MELKRYKGSLTVEQLIIAHKKTKSNANSLYKEAQLLFENKMHARCYFLLCIANEELGKSIFVVSAIVDLIAEKIDWHKFWKKLRIGLFSLSIGGQTCSPNMKDISLRRSIRNQFS